MGHNGWPNSEYLWYDIVWDCSIIVWYCMILPDMNYWYVWCYMILLDIYIYIYNYIYVSNGWSKSLLEKSCWKLPVFSIYSPKTGVFFAGNPGRILVVEIDILPHHWSDGWTFRHRFFVKKNRWLIRFLWMEHVFKVLFLVGGVFD